MADPKTSSKPGSPKTDGKDPLGQVIFIIILLFAVSGSLLIKPLFDDSKNYSNPETGALSPSKLLSTGDIDLGKRVINKELVDVRQSVAGSIIGQQLKRAVGIIKEGPVDDYGTKWWRVDYEKAPDGWVDESKLTAKVASFRSLNILPIIYDFLKPIALIFSLILFIIILVVKVLSNKASALEEKKKDLIKQKLKEVEIIEDQEIDAQAVFPPNLPTGENVPIVQTKKDRPKNESWENIKTLMESRNESDWRQAIMEADIILDSMLERMGYDGDSVGDKLKQIEESDFLTLSKAWSAHRVRNKIAHGGINFYLDKNEAERVIKNYQEVFEEFYFI